MNRFVRKQSNPVFGFLCMCTCCAARSNCRGCESDQPILQGETACEQAPSSHRHPGANVSNCAPSSRHRQADRYRQRRLSCRGRKIALFVFFIFLFLGSCCWWDTGEHLYTSTLLSVPVPLNIGFTAPRVNPTGQCCPSETDMLAWRTVPPGGLGITRSPASFWLSNSPRVRKRWEPQSVHQRPNQ